MATEKQLKANRANATRSTGPKSLSGKARSSMNSCKHGLTAETVVIANEDPKEFDELRADLENDFRPQTRMERELVDRLAGIIWRLRRVPQFEAALIRARQADVVKTLAIPTEEQKKEQRHVDHMAHFAERYRTALPIKKQREPEKQKELEKRSAQRKETATPPDGEDNKTEGTEHPSGLGHEIGLALILDSDQHDTLGKLSRYEAGLMQALNRTLSLLCNMQSARLAAIADEKLIEGTTTSPRQR